MSIKTSDLQILWRIRLKLSRLPVFPVGWLEQTLMIQTKKKTLWVFIAVFYFHIPVQSSLKSSTKGENSYVSCKPCLIDHSEKKIKFCKNICLKNVELKLLIKTIKFENVLCQINGNWSFLIRIKIKTHLICNHFYSKLCTHDCISNFMRFSSKYTYTVISHTRWQELAVQHTDDVGT